MVLPSSQVSPPSTHPFASLGDADRGEVRLGAAACPQHAHERVARWVEPGTNRDETAGAAWSTPAGSHPQLDTIGVRPRPERRDRTMAFKRRPVTVELEDHRDGGHALGGESEAPVRAELPRRRSCPCRQYHGREQGERAETPGRGHCRRIVEYRVPRPLTTSTLAAGRGASSDG